METAYTAMWSKGEQKEKAVKEAVEAMERIEGELKGKSCSYFGGESIGYLDVALGWIAYWLPVWEEVGSIQILNPDKFPAISGWIAKFLEHHVIKDTSLPPRDEMLAYFHKRSEDIATSMHQLTN